MMPQMISMNTIVTGQFFKVARLVRSYVAYVKKPKSPPYKIAFTQESFSIAGIIAKTKIPTIKNRKKMIAAVLLS